MNKSIWSVIFLSAIFLFFSGGAFAGWSVIVDFSVYTGNGPDQLISYKGQGNTQPLALQDAIDNCRNSNKGNFCSIAHTPASYVAIPLGSFTDSCDDCGPYNPERTIWACSSCKPVMKQRILDLNTCKGDIDHIANCHGELSCNDDCR